MDNPWADRRCADLLMLRLRVLSLDCLGFRHRKCSEIIWQSEPEHSRGPFLKHSEYSAFRGLELQKVAGETV
jgi:hypothetical protein